jgi:predicted nucleotidyltransferase
VEAYLAEVSRAYGAPGGPLASLVLFGSAATGGYAAPVSDVDLLLVLRDGADAAAREGFAAGSLRRRGATGSPNRGPAHQVRSAAHWRRSRIA